MRDEKKKTPLHRIKVPYSSETLLAEMPEDWEIQPQDYVVATTRYGKDLVKYLGPVKEPEDHNRRDVQEIIRPADEEDLARWEEFKVKEEEAFSVCVKKIRNHGLEMKLVSAHYLLEEPKVLFLFTAESRVDFRELVKDLVSVFRTRIELRQIGVRDESRVLGGVGVCGRPYCCHGMTDHLCPVSIKMAKEQNLSLNSMKISGPCGRLLCCLAYEHKFYQQEKKKWPSPGSRVYSEAGYHKVVDLNVVAGNLTVAGEGGSRVVVPLEALEYQEESKKWKFHMAGIIDA